MAKRKEKLRDLKQRFDLSWGLVGFLSMVLVVAYFTFR